MKKRKKIQVFKPKRVKAERYEKFSIPYMVNLLNEEFEKKNIHLED